MWQPDQLADLAAAALRQHADSLRLEQAVRGLDAMEEVEFHPLLCGGFAAAGFGCYREVPYPGVPARRPRHAERERCDLVLSTSPDLAIRDPVAELKEQDAAAGTLFAPLADALCASPGIPPEEAYWLEVKLVGQFCYTHGVPGHNRAYTSELLSVASRDLPKLARDARIRHAALMLILFSADRETADHDLGVFMHRCLDRNLPVSPPSVSRFAIPDIIGNQLCTIALTPLRLYMRDDCPENLGPIPTAGIAEDATGPEA